METLNGILHIVLSFLASLATLIVNFLIAALQLLLGFIHSIVGTAQ